MISSKAERYLADSLCDAGALVDKDGVGMLVVRRGCITLFCVCLRVTSFSNTFIVVTWVVFMRL